MLKVNKISDGAVPPRNDHAVSVFVHGADAVDLWVIDGAGSIADRNYIDDSDGDPAWLCDISNGI